MAAALRQALPETSEDEIATLVGSGEGAPGRAIRYAGLDIDGIDRAIVAIAGDGDPANTRRAALARRSPARAMPRATKPFSIACRR